MKRYAKTDEFLKRVKRLIRTEFNRLLSFDNLNMKQTTKETEELYTRLKSYNAINYVAIARAGKQYALDALPEDLREKGKKADPAKTVTSVLAGFNFVTGYLYHAEAERKRARQAEEMMSAQGIKSRFKQVIDRCASLWYLQSSQYAVDIEDASVVDTWMAAGIEEVEWVAEDDSRTCKVCRERNGKVYKIDEIPPKPHYNCRCTLKLTEKSLKREGREA